MYVNMLYYYLSEICTHHVPNCNLKPHNQIVSKLRLGLPLTLILFVPATPKSPFLNSILPMSNVLKFGSEIVVNSDKRKATAITKKRNIVSWSELGQ